MTRICFLFLAANLAKDKIASQSSEYSTGVMRFSADRAIEQGTRSGASRKKMAPYSSTSTFPAKRDTLPWWQVDLRKEFVIEGIQFSAPPSKEFPYVLHDLEVRVGSSPVTSMFNRKPIMLNSLCAFVPGQVTHPDKPRDSPVYISCTPCLVTGRFITIQIVRFPPNSSGNKTAINVLGLSDLRVIGFDPTE